jgi:hypothetical protein
MMKENCMHQRVLPAIGLLLFVLVVHPALAEESTLTFGRFGIGTRSMVSHKGKHLSTVRPSGQWGGTDLNKEVGKRLTPAMAACILNTNFFYFPKRRGEDNDSQGKNGASASGHAADRVCIAGLDGATRFPFVTA